MKFKEWTIDGLIRYLEACKSGDFDCHRVIRVSGEITMKNGELKEGNG